MGDTYEMLKCCNNSLEILGSICEPNHPNTITVLLNVSRAYGQIGDADNEINFKLRALKKKRELKLSHGYNIDFESLNPYLSNDSFYDLKVILLIQFSNKIMN
jgi:hypothetical protein